MPSGTNILSAVLTAPTRGVLDYYGSSLSTSDSGARWTASAANGVNGRLVHTVGHTVRSLGSSLMSSNDDGATWTDAGLASIGQPLSDIEFTDASHGYASGSGGMLFRTTDGGSTWSSQSLGSNLSMTVVISSDNGTAWAINSNGTIASTVTGGL